MVHVLQQVRIRLTWWGHESWDWCWCGCSRSWMVWRIWQWEVFSGICRRWVWGEGVKTISKQEDLDSTWEIVWLFILWILTSHLRILSLLSMCTDHQTRPSHYEFYLPTWGFSHYSVCVQTTRHAHHIMSFIFPPEGSLITQYVYRPPDTHIALWILTSHLRVLSLLCMCTDHQTCPSHYEF